MSAQPTWSPVDTETADLLSVLADDGTLPVEAEWDLFVDNLMALMMQGYLKTGDRVINPNHLRARIAGRIKPQRVGAFTNRALREGLVEYTGRYVLSTDKRGRNSGKPCRELRWLG